MEGKCTHAVFEKAYSPHEPYSVSSLASKAYEKEVIYIPATTLNNSACVILSFNSNMKTLCVPLIPTADQGNWVAEAMAEFKCFRRKKN